MSALPCSEVLSFAHRRNESHGMALVGGALSPLGCLRSHVRLMYQSPRDSFALWLEQPTIHPDYGGLHRRTDAHSFLPTNTHTKWMRTWIAKVMVQSHQLCHRASACLRPQLCFLMWSRSLSSNPFPLNTARSQPYFLISLFSLPCDSRMKLPSSSTWLFVSALLNSAEAVTLAVFQNDMCTHKRWLRDSHVQKRRHDSAVVLLRWTKIRMDLRNGDKFE